MIDFLYALLRPRQTIDRAKFLKYLITDQKQAITEMQRYTKLNAKLEGQTKLDEYDRAADKFNQFF
jgi:hypothetical protein